MKKTILGLFVAATLVTVSSAAFASQDGWYVFGAAGQTIGNTAKTNLDSAVTAAGGVGYSSNYGSPTVYNLDVGYQLNKNFAIEGGYLGSNNANYSASGGNLGAGLTGNASISGWKVEAVGILPVADQFSLLGKLGVAGSKDSATASGAGNTFTASGTKTGVTYGIGAKYDITQNVAGRLDFDEYQIGSSSSSINIEVWTVGVAYSF